MTGVAADGVTGLVDSPFSSKERKLEIRNPITHTDHEVIDISVGCMHVQVANRIYSLKKLGKFEHINENCIRPW